MTQQPHPYAYPPQAPRPGALPLRPLGLGDYFEGVFRVIGFGPMATLPVLIVTQAVGSVVLLMGLGMIFSDSTYFMSGAVDTTTPPLPTAGQLAGALAVVLGGLALMLLGHLAATAFSTVTTVRAASNQRTTLADAWRLFRPRAGRFLVLYLLILIPIGIGFALVGTAIATWWFVSLFNSIDYGSFGASLWILPLAGMALLAAAVWLSIKLAVALNALAVEDISATDAVRRSWLLTRTQWWRVFGILLLFGLIIGAVTGSINYPIQLSAGLLEFVDGGQTSTAVVVIGFLAASAITAAGSALQLVVTATVYTDLRFRADGLHEVLQADIAAGRVTPLPRNERPDGPA